MPKRNSSALIIHITLREKTDTGPTSALSGLLRVSNHRVNLGPLPPKESAENYATRFELE